LSDNTEVFWAKVTLYTSAGKQYREVRFENNYLSRSSSQVHFGLGKETQVEKLRLNLLSLKLTSFILFHKLKRVNRYTAEYLLVYDFFNE
jgi:hypothetical protein